MTRVEIEFPGPSLFSHTTEVRATDLSTAMHLGFDRLVGIVNDVSARFFSHIGLPRESYLEGVNTIYADLAAVYLSEAFHGDELTIEVAAGELTEKRLDLVFRITRCASGREVARARIGVLFFDYGKKKVVQIPDEVRTRLQSKTS